MKHILPTAILLGCGIAQAQDFDHKGDVTDLRVVRRVEQHPQAWRVWQPVIIKGDKKKQLLVAFGAMRNGKKDMGDIFVTLSKSLIARLISLPCKLLLNWKLIVKFWS